MSANNGTVITQGDQISIRVRALIRSRKGEPSEAFDLTGAQITTRFKGANGTDVVVPPNQHEIDPDQTANRGWYFLHLTEDDAKDIAVGVNVSWIAKVVQGGSIIHFHGLLTVKANTLERCS